MTVRRSRDLVLALGNDLLGDDGIALAAARALRAEFADCVEIVETAEAGLALVDWLEGYRRALLLDSITTGEHAFGTVLELSPDRFRGLLAPSPHCAGLPDVLQLAERLGLTMPEELRILAIEIACPGAVGEGFTEPIARALPEFVARARTILTHWLNPG